MAETVSMRNAMTPPLDGWGSMFLNPKGAKVSSAERQRLEGLYAGRMEQRLEFGSQVGPKGGLSEAVHRWFYYKEAFSPGLVRAILRHWNLELGRFIDPFAGVGTAPLVAADNGWQAVGVELLPVSAFVFGAKALAPHATPEALWDTWNCVVADKAPPQSVFPDFKITGQAFDLEVLNELLAFHDSIMRQEVSPERELLRLALLSIVEEASHTTKDGTSLRFHPPGHRRGRHGVTRTADDVHRMLEKKLRDMDQDLRTVQLDLLTEGRIPRGSVSLVQGDARQLTELVTPGTFSASITSPPYPNRYDYSANYQLELGFGFVPNRRELQTLRRDLLRSHVECPWPQEKTIELPALEEVLSCLLVKGMSTTRVFRMLAGYFEDMAQVIRGMATALAPQGRWAIVVGNVQFSAEPVPVDLMLAELAAQSGFTVEAIWVTRYKNRNVQQLVQYGNAKSRESVILLKRN